MMIAKNDVMIYVKCSFRQNTFRMRKYRDKARNKFVHFILITSLVFISLLKSKQKNVCLNGLLGV